MYDLLLDEKDTSKRHIGMIMRPINSEKRKKIILLIPNDPGYLPDPSTHT